MSLPVSGATGSADPAALADFLRGAAPAVERQLMRNLTGDSLTGYDVNWGDDDSTISCIHELQVAAAALQYLWALDNPAASTYEISKCLDQLTVVAAPAASATAPDTALRSPPYPPPSQVRKVITFLSRGLVLRRAEGGERVGGQGAVAVL